MTISSLTRTVDKVYVQNMQKLMFATLNFTSIINVINELLTMFRTRFTTPSLLLSTFFYSIAI